jgi:hypothetical protein
VLVVAGAVCGARGGPQPLRAPHPPEVVAVAHSTQPDGNSCIWDRVPPDPYGNRGAHAPLYPQQPAIIGGCAGKRIAQNIPRRWQR